MTQWRVYMKKTRVLVIILTLNIFITSLGFGFGKIEESNFTYPVKVYYISPANQDGVQDNVDFSFIDNIQPAKSRKIQEVYFNVYNVEGSVVRSVVEQFENVTEYKFDGKDDAGSMLPDGNYVYTIGVRDDKGNFSGSQPYTIYIDNTDPEIEFVGLTSGNLVSFNSSLGADIRVLGSKEVEWRYFAKDALGNEQVIFEQIQDSPSEPPLHWLWEGTNNSDALIEDGNYIIRVEARDRAGNKSSLEIESPVIVAQDGAVQIKNVDGLAFSPNGDGWKDILPLKVIFPPSNPSVTPDAFDQWEYLLRDKESSEVLYTIPMQIDTDIEFSGRDRIGNIVKDGEYKLQLSFKDGAIEFNTNLLEITIDTIAPQAAVFLQSLPEAVVDGDPLYIGGEKHQKIQVRFRALENFEWNFNLFKEVDEDPLVFMDEVALLDEDNNYYFTIETNFEAEGRKFADGFYTMAFRAEDRAGNRGGVTVNFVRDTQDKTLSVTPDKDALSAYGTPVRFVIDYTQEGLKDFNISIINKGERVVRTEKRHKRGIYNYEWDAYSDNQSPVKDGNYVYRVSIDYYNGTTIDAEGTLFVDSIPPELTTFQFSSELINPKSESTNNQALDITQKTSSKDAFWVAEIRNIFEQTLLYKDMGDSLTNISWDGKDKDGTIVPDGDYIYSLIGKDLAGNKVERDVAFIVDTGAYNKGILLGINDELPMIFFPAYSEDIFSYGENDLLYENLLNIRSVARLMKAYPDYNLKIIGHAAALLSGKRGEIEQAEVLIPLSRGRADQIRRALLILGIEDEKLTTSAVGGQQPLVVDASASEIWKNRRVVFTLSKN